MEKSDKVDLVKAGESAADKASGKVRSGMQEAKEDVDSAASSVSKTVEGFRTAPGRALGNAADRAQGALDSVSESAQKAKDVVADTQDSIVSYTREQPVKALLIAAAAGAILVTVIRALCASRNA